MRTRRFLLVCLATLVVIVPALAQEGHPMKGSWLGDWGPNKTQRTQVFIVLDWNGKALTGTINPGSDAIPITTADLEIQRPTPPPAPAQAAPPTPAQPGGGGQGGGGQRAGGGGGQRGPAVPAVPDIWLLHLEADGKSGHIKIDGKVDNLGLYNRSISGTWMQGTTQGDFKITRQ